MPLTKMNIRMAKQRDDDADAGGDDRAGRDRVDGLPAAAVAAHRCGDHSITVVICPRVTRQTSARAMAFTSSVISSSNRPT